MIAGDGITVNGGASGTLASDITLAVDQPWLENYVTENADNSVYLPLYFQVGTTEEIHTFLPAGVTTVRRANFEADGAGTDSLTLTMARDIGATTSMTVGSSATDCSAYAGHAVMFTISGTSNQTEVAAMLVFE